MAATALVAAPLIGIGSAAGAAVVGEVLSSTFEESVSPWTGRGAATAVRTTDDARTGDASMLVSGRTENWHGASTSITSLFASGGTYQLSAWVKLAPGEADTTVKATVAETPEAWTGVTPDVAVTDDEWVELTGTYTRAAGVTAGDLYFEAASATTSFLVDDVVVTGPPFETTPPPGDGTDLSFDFEDGSLSGWAPRATADGPPTVTVTESGGHESARALHVSDRVHQGQGVQLDVTDVLSAGAPYRFSAWIRFDGEPGAMTLSARTETGGTSTYSNLVSITGVTEDWTLVSGSFSLPAFETAAEIYLETAWDNDNPGNTSTFLVDDVSITSPTVAVEDLTPLQDTVPFPLGVAIDDRETRGAQSELATRHFNQVTAENHMKPYAWYAADRTFGIAPQATAILDDAVENDLRVYGHVLVWHSQNAGQTDPDPATGTPGNPGWFFFDDDGEPLTSSPEDQEILRERLETHIFDVAKALHDEYGDFGSDTNPLVAWDVVNEVVADGADNPDGLRRSAWFNVLGEQFIDLAFRYADEAFNELYAAPGSDRPVKLFINDYNTEETGKQGRYFALVERLLGRGVPLDGVGHQFHVSLTRPIADLRAAIERFEALPVVQAVTELDVATGTPVTEARLIEQGYYYRDAFDLFREKADSLYSVTVWGLYDSRSWVNDNGAPLLFDDSLTGKPAYYGAAGQDLPAPIRTADVFRGEVPLDDDALTAVEWVQLQPHLLGEGGASGSFQLRWAPTTLTVLLEVAGDAPGVELQVGEETYAFARDGSGDVPGVVGETDGGWTAVIHLPLDDATEGSSVRFNLVVDGGAGWTEPGATGILALLEELSYLEVPYAAADLPDIDGAVDAVWESLPAVVTGKQVSGTATATAEVRTLWDTNRLLVLMEVTDPDIDLTATQPWEQDSVEIYVDAGNAKNGTYLPTDMQLRINADNAVSFGNGPTTQAERVTSATARTETGYVVEVAVDMFDLGVADSVHGLDFQVNDAAGGARIGTTNWADATNQGYQSTAHWGVGRFVEGPVEGGEPTLTLGASQVRAGGTVQVTLTGFEPGEEVAIALGSGVTATGAAGGTTSAVAPEGTTLLGTVVVGPGGTAVTTVTVPAATTPGTYLVSGSVGGTVLADAVLAVLAAAPGDPGTGTGNGTGTGAGTGAGSGGGLAVTGTGLGLAALALLVLLVGTGLVVARHRGMTLEGARQTLLRR